MVLEFWEYSRPGLEICIPCSYLSNLSYIAIGASWPEGSSLTMLFFPKVSLIISQRSRNIWFYLFSENISLSCFCWKSFKIYIFSLRLELALISSFIIVIDYKISFVVFNVFFSVLGKFWFLPSLLVFKFLLGSDKIVPWFFKFILLLMLLVLLVLPLSS